MSIDKDELKRFLREKGKKLLEGKIKEEELPEGMMIRREYTDNNGNVIFWEERKITISPEGKTVIDIKSSHVCGCCGRFITSEEFKTHGIIECPNCHVTYCHKCYEDPFWNVVTQRIREIDERGKKAAEETRVPAVYSFYRLDEEIILRKYYNQVVFKHLGKRWPYPHLLASCKNCGKTICVRCAKYLSGYGYVCEECFSQLSKKPKRHR